MWTVYLIRQLSTGMGYVGATSLTPHERLMLHFYSPKPSPLTDAMKAAGVADFATAPIAMFPDKTDALRHEMLMMRACGTIWPAGFNRQQQRGPATPTRQPTAPAEGVREFDRALKASRFSGAEVATRAGSHAELISRWRSGVVPNVKVLARFRGALNDMIIERLLLLQSLLQPEEEGEEDDG